MTSRGDFVGAAFDQLDAWRHFPAYALERRADVFFALYLREVIEGEFQVALAETIIPELPVKVRADNLSCRADYMLTAKDRKRVFLVELKTDPHSRRTEQDAYLEQARTRGFQSMMRDILAIACATNQKQKYYQLLLALEQLEFCRIPSDLHAHLFPSPRRGLAECMRGLAVTDLDPTIELVYVQPRLTDSVRAIDFACFARYVAKHNDALSQRFARSLERWQSTAGMLETSEPPL